MGAREASHSGTRVPLPPGVGPGRGLPPGVGWALAGVGLGVGGWGLYRFLAGHPGWAEAVAGGGALQGTMRGLSLVTGVVPFSLAEVLVLLLLIRHTWGAWADRSRAGEGGVGGAGMPTRRERVTRIGFRVVGDLGVLVFLFYLLWGVQYARPGIAVRLGVAPAGEVQSEEMEALLAAAVRATNAAYLELHGVEDLGSPTPAAPADEVAPFLDEAWGVAVRKWGLPRRMSNRHGTPKVSLASGLFRRLGVAGIYVPFTGEALLVRNLPGIASPRSMAHEMAHQRGVASESDANVLAFLTAREAEDPFVRYGAYAFLQTQWTGVLGTLDPEALERVLVEVLPGVARDLEDQWEFWEPARGRLGAAGRRVNHTMLRTHGIPEGVASYRGSAWVFVALARAGGPESILPAASTEFGPLLR